MSLPIGLQTLRVRKTSFLALASCAVFWTACAQSDAAEFSDLSGRYQGYEISGDKHVPVVGLLETFVTPKKVQTIRIETFEPKADSEASQYLLALGLPTSSPLSSSKNKLSLRSDRLSQEEITLTARGTCAEGASATHEIKICWGKDTIRLRARPLSSGEALSLDLNKGSEVPQEAKPEGQADYTVQELVGRAKFFNYTVSQEAERVYRARQGIQVATGNLLPHLNIPTILGIAAGDPGGLLGAVGNLLPFLFPSNWYRLDEAKALSKAAFHSFASLRGNEMSAVEELTYVIHRDQAVRQLLDRHLDWMSRTQESLKREEEAGTLASGISEFYGIQVAKIAQDALSLRALVQTEYAQLAQAVALDPLKGIDELVAPTIPDLARVTPVDGAEIASTARQVSYELKTFKYLIEAAKHATQAVTFGFLDPSGSSSIGFGMASEIRISRSERDELQKRASEVESLIALRSSQAATQLNATLERYRIATAAHQAALKRVQWLTDRHLNGDPSLDDGEFAEQLSEAQNDVLAFSVDRLSCAHAYLIFRARINRLTLQGFYRDLESGISRERFGPDSKLK